MVKKFIKFIKKSPHKDRFLQIIKDIEQDNLHHYNVVALTGKKGLYRLRSGNVRFIFRKTSNGNRIIDVNNRGDIY